MPRSLVACRLASCRPHQAVVAAQLAALGVQHVEVRLPPAEWLAAEPGWADAEAARLKRCGLTASTVHIDLDLSRPDGAAQVAAAAPHVRALDCERVFVALRPIAVTPDVQCARLREAGSAAAAAGITIALETHPDLTANAEQALRTLARVDHPAVGLNFDTANIYFYNQGLDCVSELRRIAKFVTSLHLKESRGAAGERWFPALGEGIIDFAGVFDVLDGVGFAGPCTLEIDGIAGEVRTADLIIERIAESVALLRSLGRL